MPRQIETMSLGKGVEYAKVSKRLVEMHEGNKQCDIETDVSMKDGFAMCRAKVTTERGCYTGHSLGTVKAQKGLEKLETIAVGRALAFAGYLASGDIASFEEMTDMMTGVSAANDPSQAFMRDFKSRIDAIDSKESLVRLQQRLSDMIDDETVDAAQAAVLSGAMEEAARRIYLGEEEK